MKHVQLITLLLAAGLTACSSDDGTETPPAPRGITVEVTEKPFIDSETGSRVSLSPLRKAEATTTSSLDEFRMRNAVDYENEYQFKKTNGKWVNMSTYDHWPYSVNDDTPIDFYAYSINDGSAFYYKEENGQVNPHISFTAIEEVANQHDLLVAHQSTSFTASKGKVSLIFDHACAAVQFNVQITNTLTGENYLDAQSLTVNSITLKNVIKEGDFYYNNNTDPWVPGTETTYYTLTEASLTVTTTPQHLPSKSKGKYLFLIPQTRVADGTEGTYLEVKYTTSSEKTATIPLSIDWKAGYVYTINIKLGTTTIKK